MSKKYNPSGYQIIDLTSLGSLKNGDNITSQTEDGKALIELVKKGFSKPILLKIHVKDQIITCIPLCFISSDDSYGNLVIKSNDTNQIVLQSDNEIQHITKLSLLVTE